MKMNTPHVTQFYCVFFEKFYISFNSFGYLQWIPEAKLNKLVVAKDANPCKVIQVKIFNFLLQYFKLKLSAIPKLPTKSKLSTTILPGATILQHI